MGIPFFEIFATGLAAIFAVVRNYGVSIILLTVAVRLVLLPLSIKQTKSMRETQRIQPELRKLQQKYKGDRQKLTEAQMALYKEHGVNPLGGCAPLLLQFPVLIALYYVIRSPLNYMEHLAGWALPRALRLDSLDLHQFLGLRLDCSAADIRAARASDTIPEVVCGSGLVGLLPYAFLLLLMGFTTYYQQRQMMAAQGPASPQAQQMQMMARIMPVFLVVFGYSFPAALVLYWTVTNLWTIGQQRLMLRTAPPNGAQQDKSKADAGTSGKARSATPAAGARKPSPKRRTSSGDGHKAPVTSSPSARRKRKR